MPLKISDTIYFMESRLSVCVVIQIALGFFFKTRLGKGEEVRQDMECSKKKQYNYRYHLLVSGRATAITHRQLHIVFQTVVARRQETVIISLPW